MDSPTPAPEHTDPLLTADAYLLDVDGTLVDSNYLHVIAWQRALRDADTDAPAASIHAAIGLDSDKLLDRIVPDADDDVREHILSGHSAHYGDLSDEIRLLPGARELLRVLHERGTRVVLATSAPQEEVDRQLAALDADQWIDAITTAEDVQTAKPDPDVFSVAVERAGVAAERCVAIGDARWDMIAAARAGVVSVGVETGGTDRGVLFDAGAASVHQGVQEIVELLA
ncbi:HAD family hydrolase [Microbacterium sp.]|uniref:HAD family hydrolase n=1 Tax=Microbacterium sp. TaxID=51671 RepID=UPI0028A5CE1E|nr:HAD family hydrolase [Microbacterium sp.]